MVLPITPATIIHPKEEFEPLRTASFSMGKLPKNEAFCKVHLLTDCEGRKYMKHMPPLAIRALEFAGRFRSSAIFLAISFDVSGIWGNLNASEGLVKSYNPQFAQIHIRGTCHYKLKPLILMLSTRFSFPWVRIHELTLPMAFLEGPERSKLHRSFLKINGLTSTAMDLTRWTAGRQNYRLLFSHGHQHQSWEVSFQHDHWGIPTTCGASKNYKRCMNIDLVTGVPYKVKLIHCRAWKQPFSKWRMVEAFMNILFHPGGDYICASFARNAFSKQDDE